VNSSTGTSDKACPEGYWLIRLYGQGGDELYSQPSSLQAKCREDTRHWWPSRCPRDCIAAGLGICSVYSRFECGGSMTVEVGGSGRPQSRASSVHDACEERMICAFVHVYRRRAGALSIRRPASSDIVHCD
jgi:hypothetical protein